LGMLRNQGDSWESGWITRNRLAIREDRYPPLTTTESHLRALLKISYRRNLFSGSPDAGMSLICCVPLELEFFEVPLQERMALLRITRWREWYLQASPSCRLILPEAARSCGRLALSPCARGGIGFLSAP